MNHKRLAQLCEKSYKEHTFVVNELEVLVRHERGTCYLAIRGTESNAVFSGGGWRDIIRDLRITPWYDRKLGWCHAGFLKGAKAILGQLALVKGKPVVVTGHSLGAGVGQLLALLLHFRGYDVREFVGFGMPRCFIGKRKFQLGLTHYRHKDDAVSNMPKRWLMKYRHSVKWQQIGESTGDDTWRDHNIGYYVREL